MTQLWLLPDAVEDILPGEAIALEEMRKSILALFRASGYELVIPPMIEFLDSLLIIDDAELDSRTFKLTDQLGGRRIGMRADMTPQVARIDAHMLGKQGVSRLCYCGSVLHAVPRGVLSSREPIQIGAELYGHGGIEADFEVIRLMADALAGIGLDVTRIDLGHAGVFNSLVAAANPDRATSQRLFDLIQSKDRAALRLEMPDVAAPIRMAIQELPELYGDIADLVKACERFADLGIPRLTSALRDLNMLAQMLEGLPLGFDLADLRTYDYHTGVVFSAYCDDAFSAVALGGRYDGGGAAFGRSRAATGFSMDLRAVSRLCRVPEQARAILAPLVQDATLADVVAELRRNGAVVVLELPGHEDSWREEGCDRRLVKRGDRWYVEPL